MFHFVHLHKGFLSGLFAYGASEIAAKLSRLLVVVAVARVLNPEAIGTAAAALAICEIIKSLTENGVGQRIIAASDETLNAICARAYRLFWFTASALITLQICVAGLLWLLGFPMIAILVCIAAAEYLFMPSGQVQAALAMRYGKLPQTAAIAGTQIVSSNVLTVGLALILASPLILILPRVLTAPIWLISMRRLQPWTFDRHAPKAPLKPFLHYGLPVVGIEAIKALRLHADKMVVGVLLGPAGLGLYFMAFNAGLNITTAYSSALSNVVFPHLSKSVALDADARKAGLLSLAIITPLIVAQALLAPIYVPLLLGGGWEAVVPVVSILCLSALPLTLWTVSAARLRLIGKPQVELWVTAALVTGLTLSAIVTAPLGLSAMAIGYLMITTLILTTASLPLICQPKSSVSMEMCQ